MSKYKEIRTDAPCIERVLRINFFLSRNISLGKYGTFSSDSLLGHPYGLSYEIIGKALEVIAQKTLDDAGTNIST